MRAHYRDGVALYSDEDGSGDPPAVLIHGWCCDHAYLAPQFDHLRTDHRVIALDLRGHGRSDKPQQPYTIPGFAEDVDWLLGELAVSGAVLIGHSMGGMVALEVAARYPHRAAAVIAIDSPICLPEAARPRLGQVAAALRAPDYLDTARSFVGGMFLPGADDLERKARIVAAMSAAPQHVMASAVDGMLAYDSESAAAACRVPVLAIGSASPPSDFARFRARCPQLVTAQTACAGHFNQLEVPDQVNAMIDRFLSVGVPGTTTVR